MSPQDAEAIDVKDNDWIELYNRNGVVAARAVVSWMPKGSLYMYHAQTMKSTNRCQRSPELGARASTTPTQIHVKPTHGRRLRSVVIRLNYYGPTGNQRDLYAERKKVKEGELE